MFRTIVLAVDGSKYSEKAVELAKRLATATSDEVVVTHVTERLPARFQTYPGLDYEADREGIRRSTGSAAASASARSPTRPPSNGPITSRPSPPTRCTAADRRARSPRSRACRPAGARPHRSELTR
jgi:nucleotide-binding universal stress UspA family protein